ncbi:MAG: alpha-hydroxy-acid oxidizing enzyme [Acidimicrobiia bacterium]|nr:MAG: alpha-hydroxy-acid oxidizing enzyme [Acidimicrobiia bacterium]
MKKTLDRIHSLEDLQRLARRRLPRLVSDFVDGGADREVTLASNMSDFDRIVLLPRALVDVSRRDLTVEVFGRRLALPVGLAPAGLARLVDREGELAAARAAGKAGTVFCLSTASSCSIEEVAEVASGPLWFQLYLWRHHEVVEDLVRRAAAAGYEALCLTVDVPVVGKRRRDLRNGMTIPPRVRSAGALDAARRVRWLWNLAWGDRITFRNFLGLADGDDATSLGAFVNRELVNPAATWEDVARLRALWKGPLVVKGILTATDALAALRCGADGLVVSNHGGRQLDGAPSAVAALPSVVEAVGGRIPVYLDGGVRSGADVVRAKALGAGMVFVGRPWFWGLAAGGEAGVSRMLEILADEVDRVLSLIGRPVFAEVGRDAVGAYQTVV